MKSTENLSTCSFCNKHKDAVTKLIVGEEVAICNECVDLCQTLLVDQPEVKSEEAKQAEEAIFKEMITTKSLANSTNAKVNELDLQIKEQAFNQKIYLL